jgi:hypothetical protein
MWCGNWVGVDGKFDNDFERKMKIEVKVSTSKYTLS